MRAVLSMDLRALSACVARWKAGTMTRLLGCAGFGALISWELLKGFRV